MAANDKTGSLFITKEKFDQASAECGVEVNVAQELWAKLAESSTQRIIAGATAPRKDASNVNQWHWSEMDLAEWAKERLTELFVGYAVPGIPNKGKIQLSKMESCEGEASVSNRKGKRIVAFELDVKITWKGQVDYDDVEGTLHMPYISEDVKDPSEYEIKLTAKEPTDESHKASLRYLKKELPVFKEKLKAFYAEINAK
eukprot:CAMPEP_0119346264 /NCGR_PEP_ID=MMETSP1333-20130426/107915_1 /TAXON_ID=418940 /ORGANISM="Scyphosphaera apsteinii, Strain RCC1455" /LENGTH=199 /DNA_ID=CAMNT_0007358763 /DNA_START=98 /DNA_END=697 /DNA_ORIENTATION=-